MLTNLLSREEIKELVAEVFFNKQNKVTKISDESVVNALFYGVAAPFQKALKDVALVEARIFPQTATGTSLDAAGKLFSSLDRYTSSVSTTYVLLIADSGTVYPQSTTTFSGNHGKEFQLIEDYTIDVNGYGYAKVRSLDTGDVSNVDANTITTVSPEPVGHTAVTNEFKAVWGRDAESDEDFRNRILTHPNIIAKQTLQYLTEVFRLINEDVLLLQNLGFGSDSKLNISVVLQNGADQTAGELSSLLDSVEGYFSLTDLNEYGDNVGITLVNPTWYEVGGTTGVDFRVQLKDNYDPDVVRKNIQIAMSRYFDIRKWSVNRRVEWDDLLDIVKKTDGVKYVPDDYFNPGTDEIIPESELPRIKKFIMRDLDGAILSDTSGVLSPIFYPNN